MTRDSLRVPALAHRFRLVVCCLALLGTMIVPAVTLASQGGSWAPPATVYIPETGQTIDRLFLDLWRAGGGAATYGLPLTPEMSQIDGSVVQYFSYARFEYSPVPDANGNVVTLGDIGRELAPLTIGPRPGLKMGWRANSAQLAWKPVSAARAAMLATAEPSYRYLEDARHGVWGGFRAYWEATGETAFLGNPLTEEYLTNGMHYQVFEHGALQWREGEAITLAPVGAQLVARYQISTTPQLQGDVPVYDEALFAPPAMLPAWAAAPAAPTDGRAVVISLSQQALWAYEGGSVIRSTYVSTGRSNFRTPVGWYNVLVKKDTDRMVGSENGETWDVPDVPFVMYFTNEGHALHGTYWHNNFGTPMSHGCVNLPMDIAQWMYEWAPMGMPVIVVE